MCQCVQDRRLPSLTAAQTKKSIPGTVDVPFPLQQPPKPAAELGSTWMEVAELCPTAALPRHKSSREEQDEQRFVGCTRRRAPSTAPASPHARLLCQAARGGLGWLKHCTALGVAPSGSLLGSGLRREKGQWLLRALRGAARGSRVPAAGTAEPGRCCCQGIQGRQHQTPAGGGSPAGAKPYSCCALNPQ